MSKKKGVPGYPAAQLQVYDIIYIYGLDFQVHDIFKGRVLLTNVTSGIDITEPIESTVRLIRKGGGPTYATWQRRTSKLLKVMGLSRWPGAVMHEYFFDSVSPEEAAAGFMADHFLINEQ